MTKENVTNSARFTQLVEEELLPRLASTGGRRTDTGWKLRRQVPMSSETYAALTEIAQELSDETGAVSPMQVAAFAIEKMLETSNEREA